MCTTSRGGLRVRSSSSIAIATMLRPSGAASMPLRLRGLTALCLGSPFHGRFRVVVHPGCPGLLLRALPFSSKGWIPELTPKAPMIQSSNTSSAFTNTESAMAFLGGTTFLFGSYFGWVESFNPACSGSEDDDSDASDNGTTQAGSGSEAKGERTVDGRAEGSQQMSKRKSWTTMGWEAKGEYQCVPSSASRANHVVPLRLELPQF